MVPLNNNIRTNRPYAANMRKGVSEHITRKYCGGKPFPLWLCTELRRAKSHTADTAPVTCEPRGSLSMIRERLYRENHRALLGVRRRKTAATILGRGRRGAEQAGAGGVGWRAAATAQA